MVGHGGGRNSHPFLHFIYKESLKFSLPSAPNVQSIGSLMTMACSSSYLANVGCGYWVGVELCILQYLTQCTYHSGRPAKVMCVLEEKLPQVSDLLLSRTSLSFHERKYNLFYFRLPIRQMAGKSRAVALDRRNDKAQRKQMPARHRMDPGWPEEAYTSTLPWPWRFPWGLSVFEFCLFSTFGGTYYSPPGSAVWVWLNNYQRKSVIYPCNMPVYVLCGHAIQP